MCDDYIKENKNTQQNKMILEDVKNGKIIDWKTKKIESLKLAKAYKRLDMESKSIRVSSCANMLGFIQTEKGYKLSTAHFCQVRLCPICSWRRSLKIYGQLSKIVNYIEENYKLRYIFVTLTVKNVKGDILSSEINNLFKGFKLLTKRLEYHNIAKGWFKTLEITYNRKRDDYHPHIHMILAVDPDYFVSSKYIKHAEWVEIWQKCMNIDYLPSVHVNDIKSNSETKLHKTIAEIAKYTVKSNDYLNGKNIKQIDNTILTLDSALANRRVSTFGGLFKEIHKILNLDDNENGDLIHTDSSENNDELDKKSNEIVYFKWNKIIKNYEKHDINKSFFNSSGERYTHSNTG